MNNSPADDSHGHQHMVHRHRDVQGGEARAAVFGVSDGLVSNVGLILGVAGADTAPEVVRLAGLAGLVAGAVSMAAGEYNSMRVQRELYEREIELERRELERNPVTETVELAERYTSRGIDPALAQELATGVMADPEVALEFHAREELGVVPGELGSPTKAAVSSLGAFSIGAGVPLLPWLVGSGSGAIMASLILALIAAVLIGYAIARYAETSPARSIARQVAFTAVPAAITYAIGSVIGIGLA